MRNRPRAGISVRSRDPPRSSISLAGRGSAAPRSSRVGRPAVAVTSDGRSVRVARLATIRRLAAEVATCVGRQIERGEEPAQNVRRHDLRAAGIVMPFDGDAGAPGEVFQCLVVHVGRRSDGRRT